MSSHLLRGVAVDVLHEQGARADETHLPSQNVEQLGKLVEAGLAEKPADRRDPLAVREQIARGVPFVRHAAEFDQLERSASKTGAGLAKEDRWSLEHPDQESDDQ